MSLKEHVEPRKPDRKKHTLLWFHLCEIQEYTKLLSHQNKNIRCRGGVDGLTVTASRELSMRWSKCCVSWLEWWSRWIYTFTQKPSGCTLKTLTVPVGRFYLNFLQSTSKLLCLGAWRVQLFGPQRMCETTVAFDKPISQLPWNSHINRFMYIIGFMWGKELI